MKKILLALAISTSWLSINAQWNADPATNNAVTTNTASAKTGNVAVSDGTGGMFLAWIDSRTSASQSIYIQRILANGALKFATELAVTNAAGATSSTKSNLVMTSDSAGGVVLAWQDARNTTATNTNTDIYGQRVDANGTMLWAADGVRLTVSDNTLSNKISPTITTISKTEVVVEWGDNRSTTVDLYAQKVLIASGATAWAADVSIHGNQANTQTAPALMPDGSNGFYIVWQDPRGGTTSADIYAQRVDNAGVVQWGASGVAIATAANQQLSPQLVSDNAGGFVVTWSDQRTAVGDGDIYAQRVNSLGAVQWAANGVVVCTATANQSNPYIINGGSGYIITWSDARAATNNRDIYAQSIDNSGTPQWTPAAGVVTDGIALTKATGNQPSSSTQSGIQIVPDGNNGAIVIWDDARTNTSSLDIYAQRITGTGTIPAGWAADGNVISSAANNQQGPSAVTDGLGSTIIAWRDSRNGTTNSQLFASKLLLSGVLPVSFVELKATSQVNSIALNWKTEREINTDKFIVERSVNATSFSTIGTVKANAGANYNLVDNNPVTGDNFYRIKAMDNDGSFKLSSVVKITYGKTGRILITSFPNPVTNVLKLKTSNISDGQYYYRISDLKGSLKVQGKVSIVNGNTEKGIDVSAYAAGNYILQLTTVDGSVIGSSVLQKQ